MGNDYIADYLALNTDLREQELGWNRWLSESPIKRLIFHDIYGDLLAPSEKKRNILDVGGGVTAFTKVLGDCNNYTLIDMLSHDDQRIAQSIFSRHNVSFFRGDWHNVEINDCFDIVVCNDLFPNVDQRIQIFLEKYLPISRNIYILLTFHNNGRFYKVKRVDAEEIMFLQAWTGQQLRQILEPLFPELLESSLLGLNSAIPSSLYANGRQISLLKIENLLNNNE